MLLIKSQHDYPDAFWHLSVLSIIAMAGTLLSSHHLARWILSSQAKQLFSLHFIRESEISAKVDSKMSMKAAQTQSECSANFSRVSYLHRLCGSSRRERVRGGRKSQMKRLNVQKLRSESLPKANHSPRYWFHRWNWIRAAQKRNYSVLLAVAVAFFSSSN